MLIFNLLSAIFSSLPRWNAFTLTIFSFRETKNLYVTETEHLRQREKNETKSNVNKNMRTYLLCIKKDLSSCMQKGASSSDEKITRNDNNKWRSLISLKRLVKTWKCPIFRVSLDEKTKSKLEFLKNKIL